MEKTEDGEKIRGDESRRARTAERRRREQKQAKTEVDGESEEKLNVSVRE